MIKIQSSVRGERIACAFFKRFLNANRDLAPSFSTSTREMDVILGMETVGEKVGSAAFWIRDVNRQELGRFNWLNELRCRPSGDLLIF